MSTTIDHHKLNIQSFILTGNDKKLRKVLTAARARFDEADDVCFGEFLDAPDLNAGQHKHTTALIYACWKKQRNCIRALLDAGASINGTDLDGNTAGFALASLGATTLLEESLEDTLDPNHINNKGETALHVASGYGQELCVRELLRFHADPTVKDKQGKTPLLYAAGCDSVDSIEAIVEYATENDMENDIGLDAALFAAVQSSHHSSATVLLASGADPDVWPTPGFPALYTAVQQNDTNMAKLLLSADADPNTVDARHTSMLMLAIQQRNEEILRLLLKAGARLEGVEEVNGDCAISLAARKGAAACLTRLLKKLKQQTKKRKKKLRGFPAMADYEQNTPLINSTAGGFVDCMKLLLNAGADVDAAGYNGMTALMHAVSLGMVQDEKTRQRQGKCPKDESTDLQQELFKGDDGDAKENKSESKNNNRSKDKNKGKNKNKNRGDKKEQREEEVMPLNVRQKHCLDVLIRHQAELEAVDEAGATAVSWAARCGSLECVQALIAAKASIKHTNSAGNSPLQLARDRGHTDVVTLLQRAGAGTDEPDDSVNDA